MMPKTVENLPIGSTGVIDRVVGSGALRHRFMDMGFVKGTPVTVEKVAPLGDPIQVSLKGYQICLRKVDAQNILLV